MVEGTAEGKEEGRQSEENERQGMKGMTLKVRCAQN